MIQSRMEQDLHRRTRIEQAALVGQKRNRRTFVIPPFCVEGRIPTSGEGEEEL